MQIPRDYSRSQATLAGLIFWSRWLQAPLYLGLIIAQTVYVYHFMVELWHLVATVRGLSETDIMLLVLGLIDVVMIANLLIMVIVGGYETFVSKLNLQDHPDEPEWLSHVNAGVLKVKLAMALNVPTNYFFEGWQNSPDVALTGKPLGEQIFLAADVLSRRETLELIRAYYKLGERPRRRLLDLAKALQDETTDAA